MDQFAGRIAVVGSGVRAVDRIQLRNERDRDMTDNTRDMVQGHADSLRDRLATLWEAHDSDQLVDENGDPVLVDGCPACGELPDYCQGHGEFGDPHGCQILEDHDAGEHGLCHASADCQDHDDATDPLEHLDGLPLEVVWEHGTPFAVVFGTGGPHVEIVHDLRDGQPRVAVHWGGESAYAYGESVTRTADYFRELVDENA